MYVLNEKIRDLVPYEPLKGDYRVRLDANESFLPVPKRVMDHIQEAVAALPYNRYPDPMATELVDQFSSAYCVPADCITVGNGSDELISVICNAFLMRGEAFMTIEPDFSMYAFYGSLAESKHIRCEKRPDLTVDVDRVIRLAVENNVRLILFSNPCNPTSLGLPREEVRRLLRSVEALVVVDEAYMSFWNQSMLTELAEYDNLIILRTCSKSVGMAAVRLGFAAANPTLTAAMRAVKSPYNVNTLSQAVGVAILSEQEYLSAAVREISASKADLYKAMKDLERQYPDRMYVYDGCTNFVFVKLKGSRAMYEALLEKGIAVRWFKGYLRVTTGTKEENEKFIASFEKLL